MLSGRRSRILNRSMSLAADNKNHLVVRAVKELRVLLVDGDQQGTDIRDHESFFLQVALSPVADHYVQVDVKALGSCPGPGWNAIPQ